MMKQTESIPVGGVRRGSRPAGFAPAGIRADAARERVSPASPRVSLEEYYEEAGPDYAAWSREYNMHFGFYRAGANPFHREAMLEQMNAEVLAELRVQPSAKVRLLDLGCGLGATMRSFARRLPNAQLLGITRVPWQVERCGELNAAAGVSERVRVTSGDFEDTVLPRASFDGVYALESSCYAHGAGRRQLFEEARRLLRPGGRLVFADGFLLHSGFRLRWQQRVFRRLCECWVIQELGELEACRGTLQELGFTDVRVEHWQWRVAPSVAQVPWVTLKFLAGELLGGRSAMTRARWNNVLAPILLPLVSAPLGPMSYCMISATKP